MTPLYDEVYAVFEFNEDERGWLLYRSCQEAQADLGFGLNGLVALRHAQPCAPLFEYVDNMPSYNVVVFNCRDACKTLLHFYGIHNFDSELILVKDALLAPVAPLVLLAAPVFGPAELIFALRRSPNCAIS
jgi:hypothetical protein